MWQSSMARTFKDELANLTQGLHDSFEELEHMFGESSDYKGMEKMFDAIGLRKMANKFQYRRIQNQDIKSNLREILLKGHIVVERMNQAYMRLGENEQTMTGAIQRTTQKIEDYQPKYEEARTTAEQLEDEIESLESSLQTCEQSEEPEFRKKLSEARDKLHSAEEDRNVFFTVLERAKNAVVAQERQRDNIANIKANVKKFNTQLLQDIENITEIYETTSENVLTALAVKGAEQFDQAKNRATDAALMAGAYANEAISDVVGERSKYFPISPDKLQVLKEHHNKVQQEFDAIITAAEERYKDDRTS